MTTCQLRNLKEVTVFLICEVQDTCEHAWLRAWAAGSTDSYPLPELKPSTSTVHSTLPKFRKFLGIKCLSCSFMAESKALWGKGVRRMAL